MHIISLDAASGEQLSADLADELTPEQLYERHWALTVLERALERVRQAARESGRLAQFETLKPYLTGEGRSPYAELATQLHMDGAAVRAAVLRLRKRYGKALRAEIAQTVSDPSEVDDEIRRLLSVVRPWQGARE